jgi:hypothetical protein
MNDKEKEKKQEAAARARHQSRVTESMKVMKAKASNGHNNIIRFKTTFRNTIYDAMLRRGWKERYTTKYLKKQQ